MKTFWRRIAHNAGLLSIIRLGKLPIRAKKTEIFDMNSYRKFHCERDSGSISTNSQALYASLILAWYIYVPLYEYNLVILLSIAWLSIRNLHALI